MLAFTVKIWVCLWSSAYGIIMLLYNATSFRVEISVLCSKDYSEYGQPTSQA